MTGPLPKRRSLRRLAGDPGTAPARLATWRLLAVGLVAASCSGELDYEPEAYRGQGQTASGPSAPASMSPAESPPASGSPPPAAGAPSAAPPAAGTPPSGGAPPTTPATSPTAGMPSEPPISMPPTTGMPPEMMPPAAACAPGLDALAILSQRCGNCHGERAPTKGLDLITPGVGKRLVNVRSSCMGKPFLPSAGSAATSYLIEKLDGPVAGCGGQMPFGAAPLSPEERSCLIDWSDKAMARESGR